MRRWPTKMSCAARPMRPDSIRARKPMISGDIRPVPSSLLVIESWVLPLFQPRSSTGLQCIYWLPAVGFPWFPQGGCPCESLDAREVANRSQNSQSPGGLAANPIE